MASARDLGLTAPHRGAGQRQRRRHRARPPDRRLRSPAGPAPRPRAGPARRRHRRGRALWRRRPGRRPAPDRGLTAAVAGRPRPDAAAMVDPGPSRAGPATGDCWSAWRSRTAIPGCRSWPRLAPATGHAHVIGLTGPPGVGKSTTYRPDRGPPAAAARVGVLAVDPSSPFSGGALLGDRVRMQRHALDPDVFIRSMATRGHLGGLSAAAPQALRVLDAAGYDVVLVETVGVGQSEVEVAEIAATPGAAGPGDGRRGPGREGRRARDRRHLRGQQGRPGRCPVVTRELRTMIALAQRPGRLEGADRPYGRDAQARGPSCCRPGPVPGGRDRPLGCWLGCATGAREVAAWPWPVAGRVGPGDGRTGRNSAAERADGRLDPYAAADKLLAARE